MDKKIKSFFGPKAKTAQEKKDLKSMLNIDKKLDKQISKDKMKSKKKGK
jgi:hypothetical protein